MSGESMVSAADFLDSATEEVIVTRPTVQRSWLNRVLDGVIRPSKTAKRSTKAAVQLPLPSKSRYDASLGESSFSTGSTIPSTVLYLASGSNLCHEIFQGRRGIRPLSAVNVIVPELELVFDLPGVPYIEPCFANSARRDQSVVTNSESHNDQEKDSLLSTKRSSIALMGVVYEVTGDDYCRIIASEGPAYTDVVVKCHPLPPMASSSSAVANTKVFQAHTLLAPPSNLRPLKPPQPPQPSLRYLTLCRKGAAEHGLPTEWQLYLKRLEHYHTTSLRQSLGKGLFVAFWGPLVLFSFLVRSLMGGKDGNASGHAKGLAQTVFRLMWISYDYFFKQVFGDGERTEIR